MSFVLMDDVIHIGLFDGHAGHNTSSYLQVSQDMVHSCYCTIDVCDEGRVGVQQKTVARLNLNTPGLRPALPHPGVVEIAA